jgi:RHS repeat-associated protein
MAASCAWTRRTGAGSPSRTTRRTGSRRRRTAWAARSSTPTTGAAASARSPTTTSWTHEPLFQQVATTTDPLGRTTTFAYDAAGQLTGVTNPLSQQWTVALTHEGQVASVTDPLTHSAQYEYAFGDLTGVTNALGRRVRFHTDAVGRRITTTDPLGHRTEVAYTPLNLVDRVTDAIGGETSFTYDGNGNLLTLTDPRSAVTTYTYDTMDRVATRTDPVTHAESYSYDANGNLEQVTDRKGQVTAYTYDALDRLATITYADTSTTTYTYDAGNRLTQITDSVAGTITRSYDLLDRLTSETTPEGTVSYTYDAAGRRTSMTVPNQSTVSYTYDNAHRLTALTQGTATVTLAYDAADRRTSLTLPNGVTTTYGYDAANQLTSLSWANAGGSLGDLTYSSDDAGRRVALGGSFARTSIPPALPSATYDVANRILTWDGTAFTYDLNGNLTSDGTTTHTWNARNQLTALGGGASATFGYDALGRRRSKSFGGLTTVYLYDGFDVVQEQIGGSPSANYLLGLGIDERFSRSDGTGTTHYLADALGSTLALANGSGSVAASYTYEPYGATTQSGTGSANAARYTGREEDGTGLYYYRARYYDPRRQRFVSEDPLGFAAGDLNTYRYVFNQPITGTDPLGLDTGAVGLTGSIGLGVGATGSVLVTFGNGQIGIQITYGGEGVAGGGASVGAAVQYSNATSLSQLDGWSMHVFTRMRPGGASRQPTHWRTGRESRTLLRTSSIMSRMRSAARPATRTTATATC